jgi:hypothetical protein
MADGTSTMGELRDALARAKKKADELKGKTTEVVTDVVHTTAAMACSGAAGFAHQRYGKADPDTGVKIHRTNGVNTGALVGAIAKIGAGFGVAGEYSKVLSNGGTGPLCGASDHWGRAIQVRLEKMAADKAKKDETKTEAKPEAATAAA